MITFISIAYFRCKHAEWEASKWQVKHSVDVFIKIIK